MPNRWRMVVELTFDFDLEKDVERFPGDTYKDIALRAMMERAKPALETITGKEKPFAHYHIIETPQIRFDS